jgi:hypothetical protein
VSFLTVPPAFKKNSRSSDNEVAGTSPGHDDYRKSTRS